MNRLTSIIVLSLASHFACAQATMRQLALLSDSLIHNGIDQKQIPGLGLVLMKGDSTFKAVYGMANVDKGIAADSLTLFQLGSVGKIFTVIAVLQQVEAGKLSLNQDVNTYLEGFKTAPPERPITLIDLLTHSAGLDERVIGYLARNEKEVKPLADHLREFLPPSFQPPGVSINYSNYSYALAGHLVERAAGMPFTDYVTERILKPLQMTHTTYALPDNYKDMRNYASGYRTRATFEPLPCYPRHATPAGSALSSTSDMAKFMAELFKPSGKLLSDSSMALLFKPRFSNHPLLMGYTLGMEVQHMNGHHGVGKGGAFTGFLSELVIFPKDSFAIFFSMNTQTDNFMEEFIPKLLGVALPAGPTNPPRVLGIDLDEFAGVYRSERTSHRTVEELFSIFDGKIELSLRKEGGLTTYQNGAWQTYLPVDSLVFQNTRNPVQRMVFSRDASGRMARMFTNININGFWLPVSTSRVPWYDNPEMINEYYGLVLLFLLTAVFVPLYRLWVRFRSKRNAAYQSWPLVSARYLWMAALVALIFTLHFGFGIMYMAINRNEFFFGATRYFEIIQYATWVFPPIILLLVYDAIRLLRAHDGTVVFRIYFMLITLAAVIHLLFLYRWHFIGLHV